MPSQLRFTGYLSLETLSALTVETHVPYCSPPAPGAHISEPLSHNRVQSFSSLSLLFTCSPCFFVIYYSSLCSVLEKFVMAFILSSVYFIPHLSV